MSIILEIKIKVADLLSPRLLILPSLYRSHAKELEEEDQQTVFICPICNFVASSSAFLRQHRINHKTCAKCAETFPGGKYSGRIWEKHIRNCHNHSRFTIQQINSDTK